MNTWREGNRRNDGGLLDDSVCRCDVNMPEACTGGFASAFQDGCACGIVYYQAVSVEVCSTICITELAEAEEVVGKSWDDMSFACFAVG